MFCFIGFDGGKRILKWVCEVTKLSWILGNYKTIVITKVGEVSTEVHESSLKWYGHDVEEWMWWTCRRGDGRIDRSTTWHRMDYGATEGAQYRWHGLSLPMVWVWNKVRLKNVGNTDWVCKRIEFASCWAGVNDGPGGQPSRSIRCVYRADFIWYMANSWLII